MKAPLIACAIAVGLTATSPAAAQNYPVKPITIVVPFSAGGPTDTLARLIGEPMRKILGQPILVDNTTGAGGSIGTGKVVRSPPDGYMVSIGHWGTHVVNGVYYTLPFNVLTDFEPVAMIATNPQVIISKNAVPTKTLNDLIGWIKANEQKALMGTGGIGGASHMAAIYFGNRIGVKFHYITYKGGAPALTALLGGEIDLYVTQISNIASHVKTGKVRAYAVMSPARQSAAPDIPTVDEAGLPGLHTAIWHGLWLPKNTPKPVVARLNAAVVDTLTDATIKTRFAELGQEIPPRDQQTPEALFAHHKAEIDKWFPIIRAAGLKAE
jgi:tripartite-type tricarboxylate transporter receptor subunit TctC